MIFKKIGHLSDSDIQKYVNISDDDFKGIAQIEHIQSHLDECPLCQKKVARFMQIDMMLEDEQLATGLNVLRNEDMYRRKLVAGKLLSWKDNEMTAGFAKSISDGNACVRKYNNQQLTGCIQASMLGSQGYDISPSEPDGCKVDVKKEGQTLRVTINSNNKADFLVVLAPGLNKEIKQDEVKCAVAYYDSDTDKAELLIDNNSLEDDIELYVQVMYTASI